MSEQHLEALQADEFTLDGAIAAAWRGKWIILSGVFLFAALAAAAAFLMTPKYRAQVVMIPVKSDDTRAALASMAGQLGGLASLAGLSLGGGGNKDEYLQYLNSYGFTARFIEDEDLLPVLFEERWDGQGGSWNVKDPDDLPSMADGVRKFTRGVRAVQEERRTGIVTLAVVWKDRELAARWANLLVERANRDLRQRAIDEAEARQKYLDEELTRTSVVELRQSIYRLIENEIKSVMLAKVREEYAFKVIDPAVVPDADDMVRPKKLAMILIGAVFGGAVGLLIVLWRLRREPC